ncbi:hypothetical protein BBP40_010001 [Aspergillus hancockii]|nr:hypothetical protein BBP40_010001 [Aspergillus hancockii]
MGIFEEGDYYSQEDLDLFYQSYAKEIPVARIQSLPSSMAPRLQFPSREQTDDTHWPTNSSVQGFLNTFLDALDGSYCTYCAYGEYGNDLSLDPIYPDPGADGYDGKLMCGVFKPTNVISVSYGEQENDLPAFYQQRHCLEFLKLGLQGVSVFFASGDASMNGCLGNGTIFSPTFPNSCPYITNVGATKVYPGKTVSDPESGVYDPAGLYSYALGGGFSNIYPIPDYQADAVAIYFKDHNPPYPYCEGGESIGKNGGLYNRVGLAIPMSRRMVTILLCTPIFGAIINRIIDEHLALGKGPVGFINPVLYKTPSVLNDITNGSNPGRGTDGFSTAPGWDPATGLGTPNYPRMLKLRLDLP